MGKTEALVLFEPPHDFHRQPTLQIKDETERLGLVRAIAPSRAHSLRLSHSRRTTGKSSVPFERTFSNYGAIECPRNLRTSGIPSLE